ncbi:MAG: tetratricopeptide repeat protein [Candidatus Methanomethylophilaceae archaeon]
MTAPPDHIVVTHGSLSVCVPRDLFSGPDAEPVQEKILPFRKMISERYPWLSENSVDVLMRHAREDIVRTLDEETGGRSVSKKLAYDGKLENAIRHMREHLERDPNDADSWYVLGELLCKAGKAEEGYRAMNRGRSLIE